MNSATATPNPYKVAAQATKASKLTCFLIANGISGKLAKAMDQREWRAVADAAGVKPASWETQGMVMQQLQEAGQ